MSKILKQFGLLSIASITLLTPLSNSANAQTTNDTLNNENVSVLNSEVINIMDDNPVSGVVVKDISREEYVQSIAEDQGLSYKEADTLVAARTSQMLKEIHKDQDYSTLSTRDIVWRQASWTQAYSKNSSFKAEMNASFEVFVTGSFRQINSATVGSILGSGLNTASWAQSNSWKTTKYPVVTATVGVTGKFFSTVNSSTGVSGGIPGFTISSSTGRSVTYVSQSMTIQKTFTVDR